jgi:hypothetical protein
MAASCDWLPNGDQIIDDSHIIFRLSEPIPEDRNTRISTRKYPWCERVKAGAKKTPVDSRARKNGAAYSFPLLRFSQTIKMLMSAGDTPEMRAAWPRVAGRIRANFWRASLRRLGTVA